MITVVDLHRDLAGLPMLKERYGHPTDAESLKSFATLAAYRDGGIFATHFRGSSGWERHPHGDEVVQILNQPTRDSYTHAASLACASRAICSTAAGTSGS
jgi:hypothetical protein